MKDRKIKFRYFTIMEWEKELWNGKKSRTSSARRD